MAGAGRRALLLVQHKPFSFLSPSTAPRGNKRFAIDLLTQRNSASAAPWVERSQAGSSGPTAATIDPRDVPGLVCIGRLDADSTGLMLWTTDSALANRVMSPASAIKKVNLGLGFFCEAIEKEYLVRVTGHEEWGDTRRDRAARAMSSGMEIDGVPLRPAAVRWLNESQLQITLTEGKHRQARAMCDMAGLKVAALKRVRIAGVRLGGLRIGQWAALPEIFHRSLWADANGQAPSQATTGVARSGGTSPRATASPSRPPQPVSPRSNERRSGRGVADGVGSGGPEKSSRVADGQAPPPQPEARRERSRGHGGLTRVPNGQAAPPQREARGERSRKREGFYGGAGVRHGGGGSYGQRDGYGGGFIKREGSGGGFGQRVGFGGGGGARKREGRGGGGGYGQRNGSADRASVPRPAAAGQSRAGKEPPAPGRILREVVI